ncbi:MAG: glycosyltransferase family 2 protein [Gammaproteobacteria bacterium]
MKPPRIAVIVLNWNGKADTLECLASMRAVDYPDFQTVVVDNGSSDDSVVAIQRDFPEVTVLETGANLGYAGGNNAGIRWALSQGFDSILVLNNDTIVDRNLLQAFADAQRKYPNAGVFGAKIYYHAQPDVLWFAGGKWHPEKLAFEHVGIDVVDSPEYSATRVFDYVTGCALFASAEVFGKVGLLGEDFFLTYEETDWCFRASAAGYAPTYVPEARLWHKVSASFGGSDSPLMSYFTTRNRLLFVRRHMPLIALVRLLSTTLAELRSETFPRLRAHFSGKLRSPRDFYWATGAYFREFRRRFINPVTRARWSGLRDFLLRRLGDCPDSVRYARRTAH